ncbi:hypothetical protein Hypma_015821 [Hypsizygus marmoreus]|uniref:GDP-fucose protein O-fucosyltransferase 2 n=1 Tax=Hypsizygus marmoreus TaxID=39966 RepID=A0A369K2V0_HYPMA|nr:hypothetical protein Hypma_015821 [Hypsizygus marmoreus]
MAGANPATPTTVAALSTFSPRPPPMQASGYEDSETLLAHRPAPSRSFLSGIISMASRRRFAVATCSLTAVSLLGLWFFGSLWAAGPKPVAVIEDEISTIPPIPINSSESSVAVVVDPLGPEFNLVGRPTKHFRDSLRPDRKYITSWISAGWTNDVMTYINLIYLGIITDRIPIIPMFTPSHIGGAVPPIDFGLVFDVPRLRTALGKPVLEWHQVKNRHSQELDEIGCWNTWEAVQEREAYPRRSQVPEHLKLDISYTKAPTWIKVIPHFEHDMHSSFWSLAALAFPEARSANLVPPLKSPQNHVLLPPDEQLLCYDYLYYVCANQPFEFEFDYSPAWRFVGQYMYWTPTIERLADQYVRRAIGAAEDHPTPPYIAIHVRRGDFKVWCDEDTTGCFASLPVIARRVEEVKVELRQRKGITVNHIIMTSDERNTTWWEDVKTLGWYPIDHSQTGELLGPWYPVLIDAAIQSLGAGFVGTDRSTMSMLARKRVESWSDGATRIFKWGKPDSDDH